MSEVSKNIKRTNSPTPTIHEIENSFKYVHYSLYVLYVLVCS